MEVYNSSYSAQDLENAIKAVPSIGENGNWWVGDNDTGVFAGGVNVTGAEVGQTVKIAEVDEDGRPTAWEAVNSVNEWELLTDITLTEDASIEKITYDSKYTWLYGWLYMPGNMESTLSTGGSFEFAYTYGIYWESIGSTQIYPYVATVFIRPQGDTVYIEKTSGIPTGATFGSAVYRKYNDDALPPYKMGGELQLPAGTKLRVWGKEGT